MMITPTPGGSGVSEYLFTQYFSDMSVAAGDILFITCFWRILTYYVSVRRLLHIADMDEKKIKIRTSMKMILSLTVLLLTYGMKAESQEDNAVSGIVRDSVTGRPLPSISVCFDGTAIGTKTDADGKFSLKRERLR